jgi:hypothetical protein
LELIRTISYGEPLIDVTITATYSGATTQSTHVVLLPVDLIPTQIMITPDVSGVINAQIGESGSIDFEVCNNLGLALTNPTVTISNITSNPAIVTGVVTPVTGLTTYKLS